MKTKLLTFAGAVALLAVLGHFYAVPLMAQVRAALVKNQDERGRNPYIQTLNCANPTGPQCEANFPAVPANMRLVVEHVNVWVGTATALQQVVITGNNTFEYPFLQQQGADLGGNIIYVANQPLLTYFEAGETPAYTVYTQPGSIQSSVLIHDDHGLSGEPHAIAA